MLKNLRSVYIIGIGGISLSAIAVFLKNIGIKVYGSDLVKNNEIEKLMENGFEIKITPSCEEYVLKAEAVVYTSAISADNNDVMLAKRLGKQIYSRAEILGMLSEMYYTISVSGCHGKTTTTGMIANMFLTAGKDPNIHIGGIMNNIASNVKVGDSDIFVTEACEYKDSFLSLKNHVSIVLNIKPDHLDYFKNIDNIFSSFQKFVDNTDKNGIKIVNSDDFYTKKLNLSQNYISFGIKNDAYLQAKNIRQHEKGKYQFDAFYHGEYFCTVKLSSFGWHNIYNALASIAVGIFCALDKDDIVKGIESFQGIKRRFEEIKKIGGNLIIHDYAHHPDEIKATLQTCKQLGYKKIVTIFQPHTFSRTKDLYDEFLHCFEGSDEVWLLPIYPARENPIKSVTSFNLSKDMKKLGYKSHYFQSFLTCKRKIESYPKQNVLFAILGAGDIEKLAYSFK